MNIHPAFVALILTIGLPGVTQAQSFDETTVKARCGSEWPGDFQMQAYCLKQQKQGFSQIKQQRPALDADMSAALKRCENEWSADFQMQAYCLRTQIEARQSLAFAFNDIPQEVADIIRNGCAEQWGKDFQMLAYCSKTQVSAWRDLNG